MVLFQEYMRDPASLRGRVREARSLFGESQPVPVVHAVVEAGVEQPMALDDTTPEEDGRLTEKAHIAKALRIPRLTTIRFKHAVLLVDVIGVPVQDVQVLVGGEIPAHRIECPGVIDVVAIEPADEIAGRECESLVDRVGLTFVGFRSIAKPVSRYRSRISTVPSFDPPSTTMYSSPATSWSRTLRIVRSMNAAWL